MNRRNVCASYKIAAVLAVVIAVLWAGCLAGIDPSMNQNRSAMGQIVILLGEQPVESGASLNRIGGPARTLLPYWDGSYNQWTYELAFTDVPHEYKTITYHPERGAPSVEVDLEAGTWILETSAFNEAGVKIASSIQTVVVEPRRTNSVNVTLEPLTNGEGTFSWNVRLPMNERFEFLVLGADEDSGFANMLDSVTIIMTDKDGEQTEISLIKNGVVDSDSETISLSGGLFIGSKSGLKAGIYDVLLQAALTDGRTRGLAEVAHIYTGFDTGLQYTFTIDDFPYCAPIMGAISLTSDRPIQRITVTPYAEETLTTVVGKPWTVQGTELDVKNDDASGIYSGEYRTLAPCDRPVFFKVEAALGDGTHETVWGDAGKQYIDRLEWLPPYGRADMDLHGSIKPTGNLTIYIHFYGPPEEAVWPNTDTVYTLYWMDNTVLNLTAAKDGKLWDEYEWFIDGVRQPNDTDFFLYRTAQQFSVGSHTVTVKVTDTNNGTRYSRQIQVRVELQFGNGDPEVTAVSVAPSTAIVMSGESQSFTATVQGHNNPSQVVTWSLIGNHAPGTVINALGNNTAELVMAADEPNNEFTVRAVSVADNEKYGEAVVKQGYTVSFNSMGGSPVSSLSRITYGGEAVRPIDPTRAGYNFGGWYREDTLVTPWNFTDDKVLGNTTLYAKWTEIVTLTVTFEANGGIPAPSTQTVVHGGTVTAPPEMTKAGHTFGGWYREDTFGTSWSFSNTVTADTTLYAQWIPVYTVSFDSMGGSPVNSQTGISSGGKAAEPSIPTRTGYSFAGWYQNSEYTGLQWVFDKNDVTANITLYARWNVNSYTVTFNANGAASGNPPPSITADYGAAIPLPGKGTMIGPESTTPGTPKNFMGWTTTPDSSVVMYEAGGGYTIPDQNVVLYACWANPGVNVIIVPPGSILPDPFTLNKNDSTARKTIVIPGTYELIWWQVDSGAQTGPDSDKPNEFMVDSRKYTSTPLECPHQLMVRIRNVDTGEERTDSVSFWVVAN